MINKNHYIQAWLSVAAALTAMVTLVYWQASRFEFTIWDDQDYVTQNARVQAGLTGGSIQWAIASWRGCFELSGSLAHVKDTRYP